MSIYRESDYIRLRDLLRIDQAQLSEELIELPQTLMTVCEVIIEAQTQRDESEQIYKQALAITAASIRDEVNPTTGKKRPETEVIALAPLDASVISAQADLADWRAHVGYWTALGECMRAKLSCMKRLSDQVVHGYVATGSAYSPRLAADQNEARRAEMAQARSQGAPARRPIIKE